MSVRSNRGNASDELREQAAGSAVKRMALVSNAFGLAEIQGFELSISGDDVVVAEGQVGNRAVASTTLDVSALGLGDGTNAIYFDWQAASVSALAGGRVLGRNLKLGEFVEATAVATSVSLNGRGEWAPALNEDG